MKKETFNLKLQKLNFNDPKEKKHFNEKLFTEVAPKYNFLTIVLSFGRDKAWKRILVKNLPDIKKPNCLDIASGTGDITFSLSKKYPDSSITGIDLNEKMIELAENYNKFNNIEFKKADMCQTGLKAESFDIITGGYALRNAPNLKKALLEIKRIMKKNASAAFLDFSKSRVTDLEKIYHFFLKLWGSIWGIILHGNPQVYGYIAESLKNFPNRIKIKEILKETGFKNIRTKRLFFGFIEIIYFNK